MDDVIHISTDDIEIIEASEYSYSLRAPYRISIYVPELAAGNRAMALWLQLLLDRRLSGQKFQETE